MNPFAPITQLTESDRAVSTVVGVILMVGITVLLAAAVSTGMFSMAEDTKDDKPGNYVVYVEQTDSTATLTFDKVDDNRELHLQKNTGELDTITPAPGDKYTVNDLNEGDVIRATSQSEDQSHTVFQYTAPANSPHFSVDVTDTNDPVKEGDELEVEATIDNTGERGDEQTIELVDFDGNVVDTTTIQLDRGDDQTVSLSWNTETGDAATDEIIVRSEDETHAESVTVREPYPAAFAVSITGTNEPVMEGETLTVDATVENTGEKTDTQTIDLRDFDGNVVYSRSVELAGGESASISFDWDTQSGDAGTGDVTVISQDTQDTEQVTIEELDPAYYDVRITNTNSPVDDDERLDVSVVVENTGEEGGMAYIALRDFDGSTAYTQSTYIAGGSSSSMTLYWYPDSSDIGTDTIKVLSQDTTDTETVTIEDSCFWYCDGGWW